jgi:hypothetical protein
LREGRETGLPVVVFQILNLLCALAFVLLVALRNISIKSCTNNPKPDGLLRTSFVRE